MKYLLFFLAAMFLSFTSAGQSENQNTMVAKIDDVSFETQPRRITIGNAGYITGNLINPDKSLRIWLGSVDRTNALTSGTYLVVDADKPDTKKNFNKALESGEYKGIAAIKYVEETKSPRLEFHVGLSRNYKEDMEVIVKDDGYVELNFDVELNGTYWKERTSTSILGGVNRIMNKVEDKVVTKATGYDQDMDPEGWGYKKKKETDKIKITNCKVRLKMK